MLRELIHKIGRQIRSGGRFFMALFGSGRNGVHASREPLGPAGEKLAAKHLRKLGYRILARGHRQRRGEIDIIALDGKCVVFVEVKARATVASGQPYEAVDERKQRLLTRAALIYLKQNRLLESQTRFDVVSIVYTPGETPELRHIKHAFEATGFGQMFS